MKGKDISLLTGLCYSCILFFFFMTKNNFFKNYQAQQLAEDDEAAAHDANDDTVTDDELRKMITDIFIDNAKLRKQVNSAIRCALMSRNNDEAASENISLNKSPER